MAGMIFGQFILTGYLIPHGMTQKGSETSFFFFKYAAELRSETN